jgi:predicted heme/steroid binding protein
MKKLFLLLLLASPVSADMTHNITTSTQLTVNGAYTDSNRIGSTYAVSGSNIKVADDAHFGKLTAGTATAAATLDVGAYDVNTAGAAFSFSESWNQGDAVNAIGSGVDVTSGVVADMPAYGEVLTMSGGVAGSLAGTITSAGVVTVTAGGANTSAIGSVVTSVTVK